MSKRLFFVLSVVAILTGCKRDESYLNKPCLSGCAVFNVRVGTGDNSATPVGGAHVDLVWQGPKGIFGGVGKSIDIFKGYTNAQGMINMTFKAEGNEFVNGYFTLSVTGPVNYFTSSKTLFNIRNADTMLNTSVHLPYKAYVKIVSKNFDPKTPDDSFTILPTFNSYGSTVDDPSFGTVSDNPLYHPDGSAAFDSVTYTGPTAGNQYTRFSVVIHRNGVQIDHLDSLYIPKGTVGTYRVDYEGNY